MNIQIFGTKKCFDTKKAQRYFKERGIRFQFIDLKEKDIKYIISQDLNVVEYYKAFLKVEPYCNSVDIKQRIEKELEKYE